MKQKNNFLKRIDKDVLILDGAMGTMLQAETSYTLCCPELFNIECPEILTNIHRKYVDVGSDIILTNTFGAGRIKLSEFGLENRLEEINRAAIKAAVDAKGDGTLIALSMGPTGKYMEPVGEMDFDSAYSSFKEQLSVCQGAGIDIVALESFSDIKEIRAAMIAVQDVFKGRLPVLAMMTFQGDMRTVLGTSPESAAVTLSALGADLIGANCSLGPEALVSVIEKFNRISSHPLIVQPNAGMPDTVDGTACYPLTPEDMASYVKKFLTLGVKVIGGCCGTTPDHIKKIADAVKKGCIAQEKGERDETRGFFISSRSHVVSVGGHSTKIVGERINPTGKPRFIEELNNGNMATVVDMAKKQTEDGAEILDVNVGAPGADEVSLMGKAVMAVQSSVTVPIMIDSQNPDVLEAGLKAADGKVIVNSVTGESDRLDAVLPLVKRYGAAVLGLTVNESGIPKSVDGRIKIAELIIKTAKGYGIREEDIIIDCLSLAASAQPGQALYTLEAIMEIKKRYAVSTILGISNVSFGLPERGLLNSSFLSMAVMFGLDAAIVNPSNALMKSILFASDVLSNKDKNANRFIEYTKGAAPVVFGTPKNSVSAGSKKDNPLEQEKKDTGLKGEITSAVLNGNKDKITILIENALAAGIAPIDIADNVLIPALKKVGDMFEKKVYFLPQMMLSAEVMQKAFDRLKQGFSKEEDRHKGTIVIATVKGDIHDIGKNIVITLLSNYGYKVIDLGKNVSADKIVGSALSNKADIIGLSALMTTTMIEMKEVIALLKQDNIDIATIIGGAVVTGRFAQEIGADFYAKDALDAVKKAEECMLCRKG